MAFVFSYLLWLFNSTFIFLVILCWSDLWRILNWRDNLYLLHLKENVSISPLRMTFAGFFFFPHRYSLSMKRSSLLFLTYWSFYFYNHCPDWAIPPSLGLGIYNYCLLLLLMWISLCFSEVSEFPFIKKKKKTSPVLFLATHFVIILMACVHNESMPLNWERRKCNCKRNMKGFTALEII